jgi:hypothetical protein
MLATLAALVLSQANPQPLASVPLQPGQAVVCPTKMFVSSDAKVAICLPPFPQEKGKDAAKPAPAPVKPAGAKK